MSLSYELCKELKDVGFPQKKEWDEGYFYCVDCGDLQLFKDDPDEGEFVGNDYNHRWHDKNWEGNNWLTCPTLEELIDACGEDFNYVMNTGEAWRAHLGEKVEGWGGSPIEAVANLYLYLNEKK